MKRVVSAFTIFLILSGISVAASDEMTLRGRGMIKYLGLIQVYDAALYTKHPGDTANILDPEISKCLRLDYKVSLSPENFIKGANTILKRQHLPETLNRIEQEISTFHEVYRPVAEGDHYQLCYDGDKKVTTLLLNQKELISIESSEFGNIYLGIWLGPKEPIDEELRDNLLFGHN